MSLRSSNRYYAMPSELDLTPFGFTATESLAYAALLRLGPSTGYAVAHATRVARANTYGALEGLVRDRKSTRLNSSHSQISYAVFCLKKKKTARNTEPLRPQPRRGRT